MDAMNSTSGVRDTTITLTARGRYTGLALTWSDGAWSGHAEAVDAAGRQSTSGTPLYYVPGFRDVVPADGAVVYAVATIQSVLGPVDWLVPPPEGFDEDLIGAFDATVIY